MKDASENSANNDNRIISLIKNKFGSKKGLIRFFYFEVARMVGAYRHMSRIDFKCVRRIVFVCQGNICRSPLAEAIAIAKGVSAESFGLSTRGGDKADPRAIEWGRTQGINLEYHLTLRVDQYHPQDGDLLVAMEPAHAKKLYEYFANAPVQITLIGLWLEKPFAYLHDPYNANSTYFEFCEQRVVQSVSSLLDHYFIQCERGMPNV